MPYEFHRNMQPESLQKREERRISSDHGNAEQIAFVQGVGLLRRGKQPLKNKGTITRDSGKWKMAVRWNFVILEASKLLGPNMHTKRSLPFLLAAIVVIAAACDPAVTFRPSGWKEISQEKWSHSFGDVDLETESFGGILHSPFVNTFITIKNHGADEVFVTRAVLKVHDLEYESKPLPAVGIGPGDSGKFGLWFDLPEKKTIRDCLNSDTADILLTIKYGDNERSLVIPFSRGLSLWL